MDSHSGVRVEEYLDFRVLLRDLLATRQGSARSSYRALSRRAGLRSTNYLSLVLKGERTPSELAASDFDVQSRPDILPFKYGKLLSNLGNAIEVVCGPAARKGPIGELVRH